MSTNDTAAERPQAEPVKPVRLTIDVTRETYRGLSRLSLALSSDLDRGRVTHSEIVRALLGLACDDSDVRLALANELGSPADELAVDRLMERAPAALDDALDATRVALSLMVANEWDHATNAPSGNAGIVDRDVHPSAELTPAEEWTVLTDPPAAGPDESPERHQAVVALAVALASALLTGAGRAD